MASGAIVLAMINAEVTKSGNESALSTIRKFSRRVQGTGLIRNARSTRYFVRGASKIVKKKRALKLIKRRLEYSQLIKEGKVSETPVRRGAPHREQHAGSTSSPQAGTRPSLPAQPARAGGAGESTPSAR